MDIFFNETDRLEYLHLMRKQGDRFGVKFLAYCLMTNHVHLLAVPDKPDSLARAIGEAHRLYTRMINFRDDVRGYLFQGRFSSCPVSTDQYFLTVIHYILNNPVKAKLVQQPWEYRWSSADHLCGLNPNNTLVQKDELLTAVKSWQKFLTSHREQNPEMEERLRTGRPFGPDTFHDVVYKLIGVDTRPKLPGRPSRK